MSDSDENTVQTAPNGPYLVTGKVTILDVDGKQFEVPGAAAALCRCGGSENKPFCDGTHATIGFESEPHAG